MRRLALLALLAAIAVGCGAGEVTSEQADAKAKALDAQVAKSPNAGKVEK